jgi:hypothetical protein
MIWRYCWGNIENKTLNRYLVDIVKVRSIWSYPTTIGSGPHNKQLYCIPPRWSTTQYNKEWVLFIHIKQTKWQISLKLIHKYEVSGLNLDKNVQLNNIDIVSWTKIYVLVVFFFYYITITNRTKQTIGFIIKHSWVNMQAKSDYIIEQSRTIILC